MESFDDNNPYATQECFTSYNSQHENALQVTTALHINLACLKKMNKKLEQTKYPSIYYVWLQSIPYGKLKINNPFTT